MLLQFTAAQPVILPALDIQDKKWRHPADDANVNKILHDGVTTCVIHILYIIHPFTALGPIEHESYTYKMEQISNEYASVNPFSVFF